MSHITKKPASIKLAGFRHILSCPYPAKDKTRGAPSEQFSRINTLVDEALYLLNHAGTVGGIGHAKPLAGGVEHLNGSRLVADEFVDHQGNEELGLLVLHILGIRE